MKILILYYDADYLKRKLQDQFPGVTIHAAAGEDQVGDFIEEAEILLTIRISDDLNRRFPGLNRRANRYLSLLQGTLALVVYFIAALGILQSWGVDSFGWLTSPFGQRLTGSLLTIIMVIMASVILSFFGVFFGLLITFYPFGIIMTGIGIISLAGVVVNNAIVLIDYIPSE